MDSVDEFAGLREIKEDDSLRGGTEGGVAECAHGKEDGGDNDHDSCEDFGEFFGMFHSFLDWDYKTDTFECEDCGSDEEGPVVGVKGSDVGETVRGKGEDVVVVEIEKAEDYEEVGDERGGGEFCHVADHREGEEDENLEEDEVFYVDDAGAVGYSGDEGGEVLGGEDDVGCSKTDLGYDDREED